MPQKRIVFRVHAVRRMFERGISVEEVRSVLEHGETIENYPEDVPYPSRLMLGWSGSRPIHVVVAENVDANERIVITAYVPDPLQWEGNFKKRTT